MAALFALVVLTLCAVLATLSWAVDAGARPAGRRRPAGLVSASAALGALASVGALVVGDASAVAPLVLLVCGALLGAAGTAAVIRAARPDVATAAVAADAAVIAGSAMILGWAVLGVVVPPGPAGLTWTALTTIDLFAALLIVRVPTTRGPGPLRASSAAGGGPRRSFPGAVAGVAALGCLAVGDALMTMYHVGSGVAAPAGLWVRALGYAIAVVVPWVPAGALPRHPSVDARAGRSVPYAIAALAVTVLLATSVAGGVGIVPTVFAALVVAGLGLGRAVAVRENADLARDLHAATTQLGAVVGDVRDVVLGIDGLGRVTTANDAARRLLHRAPAALRGLDVSELVVTDHRPAVRRAVDDVVHGRRTRDGVEVLLAPPATGTARLRLNAVPGGAVADLSDLTEADQLRDRLDHLARYDELTGLANRAQLLDEVAGWLRSDVPVTVLCGDLDAFRGVNERFGYGSGDEVLTEAARRLRGAADGLAAADALVARTGGDEFVVALAEAPDGAVPAAAERLLDSMRPTFAVGDRAVRIGIGIGVATSADLAPAPRDAEGLLHRADVAMVAAKRTGRFRWLRWDAATEARSRRRVDVAIGLRRALDSHRLALAYQPLVRLSDGGVVGLEALLRVEPDDDAPGALAGLPELVSPAELVAVAEDTGEIGEMGQWVIIEATRQAARWRAMGHDVLVAVNVSVRQLGVDGFVDFVRDALADAGVPPAGLAVEITEGHHLREADPAWDAVGELHTLGVTLVIDDFGTGYSSLAYLRHMPVRGVKLDRALLGGLTTDPRARTLARAVIGAARALGLLVVAEGLETPEAVRVVRDLGAWAGQGFALHSAMPPEDVDALLAGGASSPRPADGSGDRPADGSGDRPVRAAGRSAERSLRISDDETAREAG